ncbi:MAG: hypothetical protein NC191_00670 [Muribaculaceae bacterium]|nr:hypothetical protein [Muribaculaceae bacterium]
MSFLLGAFGKLSASRRKREIESQKMRIQVRLQRATKQVGIVDKQISRAEQTDKNNLKAQMNQVKANLQTQLADELGLTGLSSGDPTSVDQTKLAQYNNKLAMCTSQVDAYYTTVEQQITDYYENLRDTQLEPLKDEEFLLKAELDQLDSQAQLAEGDLKFCQDMEKGGAKELIPQYSSGGN